MEVIAHLKLPPVKVLAANGTSFHFASLVFNKEQQFQVAKLYQACRYIDDCADELPFEESKVAIKSILSIADGQVDSSEFSLLLQELEEFGVNRAHLKHLIDGAVFDLNRGRIDTQEDLLLYCYRVAGVVGLMMCPLLGVVDKKAYPFALDLGIAMQLTNICRDILEDAQGGRSYLPADSLNKMNLGIHELAQRGDSPKALKVLVKKYLMLADHYYESGYRGLAYIPLRPRLCILLAGEVYRAIGKKIAKVDFSVLQGRTYLSMSEKLTVVLKTLPRVFLVTFWKKPLAHESSNHSGLINLPGIEV